jgi:PPOX class probable F420-dependent enzyme
MATMTPAQRETFLNRTRLGILTTLADSGDPVSVPVWFEWDGSVVRFFSFATAPKVARLRRRPRASMLVVNDVGESEAWVAFDGDVSIDGGDVMELAQRLAARYWDLQDPARANELAGWRAAASSFCLLTLKPTQIRSS